MIFSSVSFLLFFLPIFLVIYYLAPKNSYKNFVLLVASLIFYAWGEPIYILLMIFSSLSDYFHGLFIEKHRDSSLGKIGLISSIAINIGLLMFFKYGDFLILNLNRVASLELNSLNLPLPIGISFYTFQTMSYAIDVYSGKVQAQRNPLALATYVAMFPQLIAGPIVRYKDISIELIQRTISKENVIDGFHRFSIGLLKKVLIANKMSEVFGHILSLGIENISTPTAWIGSLAFAFQIYFDFSGYSDMAIGLGKMLGFNFLENFNYPYMATSITDFWRRWHISLGSWFRDYVYIPLGGNRVSLFIWIRNLFIVWFLTGLWHGASWNFVIWGLYFAVLLLLEKYLKQWLDKIPLIIRWGYTMVLVLTSWIIFYFEELSFAKAYVLRMVSFSQMTTIFAGISRYEFILVFAAAFVGCTPLPKKLYIKLSSLNIHVFADMGIAILLIFSIILLSDGSPNPFIYFRF